MYERIGATLKLENGMEFRGWSFGWNGPCDGEVVFSNAMVGYPESLTDPSYSGQILCVTYPLIGNYGVPLEGSDEYGISRNFESERIWVRGLVISECSFDYSHWDAVKSLDEWLKEQKIPGIFGIATRAVTHLLRDKASIRISRSRSSSRAARRSSITSSAPRLSCWCTAVSSTTSSAASWRWA